MATLYYKVSASGPSAGPSPTNENLFVGNLETYTDKYSTHWDNTGTVHLTLQITAVAWAKPADYATATYEEDHNEVDHSPYRAWHNIYVPDPSTVLLPPELEVIGPPLGLELLGTYTNASKTAFGFQNVAYDLSTSTVAGVSFGDFSFSMKDNFFTIAQNAAKAAGLTSWATAIGNAGVVRGALENIVGGGLNLLEMGIKNFDNPNFNPAAYDAALNAYLRGAQDTATQALIDTTMFPGNPAAEALADKILGGARLVGIVARDGSLPVSASAQFGLDLSVGGATLSTRVTGTARADLVLDGSASSTLDCADGDDWLSGGRGDDTLLGGAGNDRLYGGAGNDVLDGGDGGDTMRGGLGNDVYKVNSSADRVDESSGVALSGGVDTVQSRVGYTLGGGVENLALLGTAPLSGTGNSLGNSIIGNSGANRLDGRGGNDTLDGGAGADVLIGGAGSDSYVVDHAGDKVYETRIIGGTINAGGTDTVRSSISFSLGAHTGVAFVEKLTLTGTAPINGYGNALGNVISGNGANNMLSGGGGRDIISGAAGNDLLRGGADNDTLIGGAGNDLFRFDAPLSRTGAQNVDHIRDFNPLQDTIQLENSIFTAFGRATTGPVAAVQFRANITGLAQDSNDYLIYETDTGKLFYDANGNAAGGSVQIALLQPGLALTSADYVLV